MDNFNKVVRLGKVDTGYAYPVGVFCEIKWNDGRLSISGVEGPKPNEDAHGSCGQIVMSLKAEDFKEFAPGWSIGSVQTFLDTWERWHLNDMTSGSPAQEAWLRANPVNAVYPDSHYTKACEALEAVNLNPDPDYAHNGTPYKYGHAWLHTSVPEEVLALLVSYPDTDITPAWV